VAFARAKPKTTATLYLYAGPSINFGQPTQSAFLAVAGPTALLKRVHAALAGLFQVRYSDYISHRQAVPFLHLQAGHLYEATDESQWHVVEGGAT
jgi:hypothetical protein